ncbi:hypothetical protein CJP72_19920 [Citrobacter sp. NCU1]|uniref:hypothetical protein n=1 Tax=Citrobacter sp. NCU1 TaxID=2026683 RepID=UPI001391EDF9|nr:hypothetical protein [Citrobacter sp. NCU1]NDO82954.1 hypothetical protein [Citrobacter sp. NCU1]
MTMIDLHSIPDAANDPEIPKKKAGRPPIIWDNTFTRTWLLRRCPASAEDMSFELDGLGYFDADNEGSLLSNYPSWVNDVVTGAARLNGSAKYTGLPMNRGTMMKMLRELPVISSANVGEWMNRRSFQSYSKQYIHQVTNAVMSASKSIDFWLERLEAVEAVNDDEIEATCLDYLEQIAA